jgi:prevent-host-death family protein
MISVGTKELKNRLSHYLRLVRRGAHVVVTDRGRPVAELKKLGASSTDQLVEAHLAGLAADGILILPGDHGLGRVAPIEIEGPTVSDAVVEDRR